MKKASDFFIGQVLNLAQPNAAAEPVIVTGYVYGSAFTGAKEEIDESMLYVYYVFKPAIGQVLASPNALVLGWNFEHITLIPNYKALLRTAYDRFNDERIKTSLAQVYELALTLDDERGLRPGNYAINGREVAPTGAESFIEEKLKFPTQEEAIIEVLHVGKLEAYHARDVQRALSQILGVKMLLTSVRRALSNLHKAGKVKGDKTKLDATTKKNVRAYYIPRKPERGQIELF
jgi:hypothetical protein